MHLYHIFGHLFDSHISLCFHQIKTSNAMVCYFIRSSSPLPALGRINEEFFRDILLDKLNKDKVVLVFLEENVS